MNSEELQVAAFEIILNSGNARSIVHEAFDAMRDGDYALAEEKLKESNDELLKAHQSQTHLLQDMQVVKRLMLKSLWFMPKTI